MSPIFTVQETLLYRFNFCYIVIDLNFKRVMWINGLCDKRQKWPNNHKKIGLFKVIEIEKLLNCRRW